MSRPCRHDPPVPGRCVYCCLVEHDPRYRQMCGVPGPASPGRCPPTYRNSGGGRFSARCTLRGPATGEVVRCDLCGGKKKELPVYECKVHGRCTVEYQSTAAGAPRWCRTCKEKCQMSWAYGVTTVKKRRDDLLPRTLKSLAASGFDRPRLFVDGDDDGASWRAEFGLDVTARGGPPVRTAGNWVLSLYELFCRDPHADLYAVFQDDLVCSRNLMAYLERNPCPVGGYMNLYTFPYNQRLAPKTQAGGTVDGWFRSGTVAKGVVDGVGPVEFQIGLGAVALVFPRDVIVDLLGNRELAGRPRNPDKGHCSIDGGVVHVMNKMGFVEYVHSPSLVQHTGHASSMGHRRYPDSESFRGEGFDLLTLAPSATEQRGPVPAAP